MLTRKSLNSSTGKTRQPPGKRSSAASVSRHDQDSVVALNRPDRLRQLRAVDRLRERRRFSPTRTKHDELLHAIGAAEKLAGGPLERGERRFGTGEVPAWPLIGPVAGPLDEPKILDVPRNRRLRCIESALVQASAQLLLAVECIAVDQLKDDGLSSRFH